MTTSSYKVPADALDVEEVIKNSQFITRVRNVISVEQARAFIKLTSQQYADASHNCWAYIVGNPQSTTLLGCSDDGEPSGTAGKPMLHVLQHSGLGDIVAVCTRYFGGTKLGTGGLARAYGGGTKLALERLAIKDKIHYSRLCCHLEYSQLPDFEHLVKDFQTQNLVVDYQSTLLVNLEISSEQKAQFKQAVENKFRGQVKWKPI